MRSLPSRLALGSLLACMLTTVSAKAEFRAVGHEFRPTAAQRESDNGCTGPGGITASIVPDCPKEALDDEGHCDLDWIYGVIWSDAEGRIVAGPYRISEQAAEQATLACIGNTALVAYAQDGTATVRAFHRGRRPDAPHPMCEDGGCGFNFAAATAVGDKFLVSWNRGPLVARYFERNGEPASPLITLETPAERTAFEWMAADADETRRVVVGYSRNNSSTNTRVFVARMLDGERVSDPVQLNEFPSVDTSFVRVHAEADGEFVVAWDSRLQAGPVARRVVDDTIAATTTTTTTTLPADVPRFVRSDMLAESRLVTEAMYPPALAGDASGNWIARWQWTADRDAPPLGAFLASTDDGRRWSTIAPYEQWMFGSRGEERIATDERGNWITVSNGGSRIVSHRSSDGGRTWGEADVIQTGTNPLDVRVARGRGGVFVVAWLDPAWSVDPEDENPLSCITLVSVSRDAGHTWSSPRPLARSWCNEVDRGLGVASDNRGNWRIVWITDQMYELRSTDNAYHWSDASVIPDEETWAQAELDLAADSRGRWLLAFSALPLDANSTVPRKLFVARAPSADASWTAPEGFTPWHESSDGLDESPSIASSGDRWGIAWRTHTDVDGNGLDGDIVVSFSNDGAQWSAPQSADSNARGDSYSDEAPRLVHAGADTWGVLWRTTEGYEDWSVRSLRFARTQARCGNARRDVGEDCDDGNAADGDGCDSNCLATGCGNAVVTPGEECDDANDDDTDDCVLGCRAARCGDGVLHRDVEACDDGNGSSRDACVKGCVLATCGDAFEQTGVEECDDGNDDNNDACLRGCAESRCGDGYLQTGVEECDDASAAGCRTDCTLEGICAASLSKHETASHAVRVLRKAVGMAVSCPRRRCDMDRNGRITTLDALHSLRLSVGLSQGCATYRSALVRLESAEFMGALQLNFFYRDANAEIREIDGAAACTLLTTDEPLTAINVVPVEGVVRMGIVSAVGFQGPMDLVRCEFAAPVPLSAHAFEVEVVDATDTSPEGWPIEPKPRVVVIPEP